jgi:RHS repeat-associated protein
MVWGARHGAWGAPIRLSGDVDNPLGLQGQYHDEETDLFYTRHRYYNCHTGTFISFDPVGIAAGENICEYSPNIFCWIDPIGLAKCRIPLKKLRYALGYYKHNPAFVSKGVLFRSKGFAIKSLRSEVDRLFREGTPNNVRLTAFGKQFSVVGEIISKSGQKVNVATGWIIDHGSRIPRLTISPD